MLLHPPHIYYYYIYIYGRVRSDFPLFWAGKIHFQRWWPQPGKIGMGGSRGAGVGGAGSGAAENSFGWRPQLDLDRSGAMRQLAKFRASARHAGFINMPELSLCVDESVPFGESWRFARTGA